ncbi:uncharacterized protein LOC121628056 [Melanotaenia boesemani]|uniref:uncharacterized protein LOC121628056 n=1 Tax=Melanotaenia boesemani TaxID=1250792 RepID=UPI001C0593CD|nr:uncharacterized protein LOC121628056 [Melanotaenia boesemani]
MDNKMLQDPWMPLYSKSHFCAFAPFPRSTWVHPNVPRDSFDLVCKIIWSRMTARLREGESLPQGSSDKVCISKQQQDTRAKEWQRDINDFGVSTQYEVDKKQCPTDFTLSCPYLSGHIHPNVAKPARETSPAVKLVIKLNNKEAKRREKLGKDTKDKGTVIESPVKKMLATQTSSRHEQSAEDHDSHLPSKVTDEMGKREDEPDTKSVSDGNSGNNDEFVNLPEMQTFANNSDGVSLVSDTNEERGNKIPHLFDDSSSDRKQDSQSSKEKDFPQISTNRAGNLLCPTEPSALGKAHGQWETPLSLHLHKNPTATLASGTSAPVQAPVQSKALKANSKTDTSPVQQQAYDLLADFPALQPPEKPSALDALRHRNPKTKAAEVKRGLSHSTNHCQGSGVSHEKRVENVPREVASICSGDQESVLNIQKFGLVSQCNSPTVSCEETKANVQQPPRVTGADCGGVNARSWAIAAKAGRKQAAAVQEKARPCIFQRVATITGAKAPHSADQKSANKVKASHYGTRLKEAAMCQDPKSCILSCSAKPDDPEHQLMAAGVCGTLQQMVRARRVPPKNNHV